jgi:hypothetical protein
MVARKDALNEAGAHQDANDVSHGQRSARWKRNVEDEGQIGRIHEAVVNEVVSHLEWPIELPEMKNVRPDARKDVSKQNPKRKRIS